jgi:hypothetical protein
VKAIWLVVLIVTSARADVAEVLEPIRAKHNFPRWQARS